MKQKAYKKCLEVNVEGKETSNKMVFLYAKTA